MTEDQIKTMVDRFLTWRLPENFSPDAGISFKATYNENTAWPMKHEPLGTNLFDATEATAMVRHMVEGLVAETSELDNLAKRCNDFNDQINELKRERGEALQLVPQWAVKVGAWQVNSLTERAERAEAENERWRTQKADMDWLIDGLHSTNIRLRTELERMEAERKQLVKL